MLRVDITESAARDLDQVADYLAVRLANPPAAIALLDEVESTVDALEDDSELFPLCKDERLAELGYRKAIVGAYIMIYEVDVSRDVVRVLRFFHGSEDYSSKL